MRQAENETFDAMKAVTDHRHDCAICRQQQSDDLKLCPEGERLAQQYFAVTHDVLQRSEIAPNDSDTQGRVSSALDAFLRHRQLCVICR